jgi:hypothetical protein
MIIATLQGGMGNQMFQYAAARALAQKKNTGLRLYTGLLAPETPGVTARKYELEVFNFTHGFATSAELEYFKTVALTTRVKNKVLPYYKKKTYTEPYFHYDENFFKTSSKVLLDGYWQSEKYFKHIGGIIRKDFKITAPLSKITEALFLKIVSCNAVSLHIRRGDYVSNPETQRVHGNCELDYYNEALAIVAGKAGAISLFVFSDDIAWAKKNIKTNFPATFVEHTDAQHAYEDLYLMSHCKHNIIANSSFSWWAGWLNSNENKIVVAPSRWFNDYAADTKDLLPEEWIEV